MRLDKLMSVIFGLVVALAILPLMGCTASLVGSGEVGFKMCQDFALYHRASQTSEKPSTAELEVPALLEWINKQQASATEKDDKG